MVDAAVNLRWPVYQAKARVGRVPLGGGNYTSLIHYRPVPNWRQALHQEEQIKAKIAPPDPGQESEESKVGPPADILLQSAQGQVEEKKSLERVREAGKKFKAVQAAAAKEKEIVEGGVKTKRPRTVFSNSVASLFKKV